MDKPLEGDSPLFDFFLQQLDSSSVRDLGEVAEAKEKHDRSDVLSKVSAACVECNKRG